MFILKKIRTKIIKKKGRLLKKILFLILIIKI